MRTFIVLRHPIYAASVALRPCRVTYQSKQPFGEKLVVTHSTLRLKANISSAHANSFVVHIHRTRCDFSHSKTSHTRSPTLLNKNRAREQFAIDYANDK